VHGSLRRAAHRDDDAPVLAGSRLVAAGADLHEMRLTAADGAQRFAAHDVAGARPADETFHRPVREHDRAVAEMRADGRAPRDDRRDREAAALALELGEPLEDAHSHHSASAAGRRGDDAPLDVRVIETTFANVKRRVVACASMTRPPIEATGPRIAAVPFHASVVTPLLSATSAFATRSTTLPSPPPEMRMPMRERSGLGSRTTWNVNLPRTGPTATPTTASNVRSSTTVDDWTSGMQDAIAAGLVMNDQTASLLAGIVSVPEYSRFIRRPSRSRATACRA